MTVRLSLSKVIVRLCSAPRTAAADSSSSTSRATSTSRSRSERKKQIRSGKVRRHGVNCLEHLPDVVEEPEIEVIERAVSRRAAGRVRDASSRIPLKAVGQQEGAELGQAPAAGGTYAPHLHAEFGGYRRVIRPRHEGDDAQQFLAPRGQLADGAHSVRRWSSITTCSSDPGPSSGKLGE